MGTDQPTNQLTDGWTNVVSYRGACSRLKTKEYNLTDSWDEITGMSVTAWKIRVKEAGEKENKNILMNQCYKRGTSAEERTNSKSIINHIHSDQYKRSAVV
jgi:hypothetical protein